MDEEVYGAQTGRDIEGSWAGGKDGMRVTDNLLNELDVCGIALDLVSTTNLSYRTYYLL